MTFRVAGRFAARSDWQTDLGDFGREMDEIYEQSRLMTEAGQKAKQDAPSATKVAARRVDTKRRR